MSLCTLVCTVVARRSRNDGCAPCMWRSRRRLQVGEPLSQERVRNRGLPYLSRFVPGDRLLRQTGLFKVNKICLFGGGEWLSALRGLECFLTRLQSAKQLKSLCMSNCRFAGRALAVSAPVSLADTSGSCFSCVLHAIGVLLVTSALDP
jgi:hypothetical protein